jgi:hypothetical protein
MKMMAMSGRKYDIARWTLCLGISLLLVLVIATTGQVVDEENTATTCDAMDGTCNNEAKAGAIFYRRDLPASYCSTSSGSGEITTTTTKDLYRYGGTAQTYKPGTVVSSNVCSETLSNESLYKVASWPFTRRTSKTSPIMNFTLKLYGCSNEDSKHVSSCDCSPLVTTKTIVEIWQTRPDGLYGSPRNIKNDDDDECRATIPVDNRTGNAHFTTVAPGSAGIMGGLGPRSSDYWPYGPPVIHILVTTPPTSNENNNEVLYAPLLLDLPALIHPTTLERRSFSLSAFDWRGQAWSKRKLSKGTLPPFDITSWNVNDEKNRIDIDVDIFLERIQPPVTGTTAPVADPEFCPSLTYILPGAFFLEPIAVCAKSLLDFFPM